MYFLLGSHDSLVLKVDWRHEGQPNVFKQASWLEKKKEHGDRDKYRNGSHIVKASRVLNI